MSFKLGFAPMAGRFKKEPSEMSVNPFFSQTSNRPSPSVSWTDVLNTIAPHERQSVEVGSLGVTLVLIDASSPDIRLLTSKVRLSHAEPSAPWNGLLAETPMGTLPFTVSCSWKLESPSPTICVIFPTGLEV